MSLISRSSRIFRSSVVERGRSYFTGGRVEIVDADAIWLAAHVRGSRTYMVEIHRDGGTLAAECDCPYFTDNLELCKHVVATILEAERKNLPIVRDIRRVDIIDPDMPEEEYAYDLDDEEDEDDYDEAPYTPIRPTGARPSSHTWARNNRRAVFDDAVARIERKAVMPQPWPSTRKIFYVVDADARQTAGGLLIEVMIQDTKKNGEPGALKSQTIPYSVIPQLPDPADRLIIAQIAGGRADYESAAWGTYTVYQGVTPRRWLDAPLAVALVPEICRTGRCLVRSQYLVGNDAPVAWDDGPAYAFRVAVQKNKGGYAVTGVLQREIQTEVGAKPLLFADGGFVFFRDRVARFEPGGAAPLAQTFFEQGEIEVAEKDVPDIVGRLLELPISVRVDLPKELQAEEIAVRPVPRLTVSEDRRPYYGTGYLSGHLSFDYDGTIVEDGKRSSSVYDAERRRLVRRDEEAERTAAFQLAEVGFTSPPAHAPREPWRLPTKRLPAVVGKLLVEGWHVEAEGKLYRRPGEINVAVSSGIDWFDLEASVDFGGVTASLPELLAALKRGDSTVLLDDGTFGLLPEQWLRKHGLLASAGTVEGDRIRFKRTQVGVLDALLAAQPDARVDRVFSRVRRELRRFEGIRAADPPASFKGELREYQREGLGWMQYLQRFGLGGCLADDMGLGKTVQVLALLESRRVARSRKRAKDHPTRPSLAVVPKSLIFNWKAEAERFTPKLRVLDYTGKDRPRTLDAFEDYDLVLTTYGTLRRDATMLVDTEFDYVVLDEAQAIKNPSTASAKAARLMRGDHRLALSGTPIENHLGELWSLVEFLNPGLLGSASVFKLLGATGDGASPEAREGLARAVRPFILRRTKEKVAKELPPKVEQTIYCELETKQRKLYDQLRDHYRASLLGRIERDGIKRSKIHVLEALLRLRQAACHPGLVDKKRTKEPSAKIDVLLERLAEVVDEGHKALVFSQFTSLLAILRDRLDRKMVSYEYLDGQTRDRAERVERFQSDSSCKLFLISLKAGGLGLNLTEAEYVFLLDPWWNPAVEAQAIDRAHRIGQQRNVFAFRLIAKDTVEEKVLALQQSKRELADAIIREDDSLIRTISAEDIALLLS